MAKMKLKQLRDADVRYISLVDRAATRIPFRVLKREKENQMGIDLTKVFKSEDTGKPYVSALVVFAQKDEATASQVVEAIKKHGFITDRVQKSDEGETLVYAQVDQPKDACIVRLSDQTLVNVANLKTPSGWIGEMVNEHGFFPDLKTATTELYSRMAEIVTKSDNPQEEAEAALTSYADYLGQMVILPSACYKLDVAITELVQKGKKLEAGENPAETAIEAQDEEAKKKAADKKKKDYPGELAPKDEEDDQKPPPDSDFVTGQKGDKKVVEKKEEKKVVDEKKVVEKCDEPSQAILTALKGIETSVKGLSEKMETVVKVQDEQKKVLDDVVQKTDTLGTKLGTTVVASPVPEDRPAGPVRMRVQKDDDPRTGNFDTAFLRRRK